MDQERFVEIHEIAQGVIDHVYSRQKNTPSTLVHCSLGADLIALEPDQHRFERRLQCHCLINNSMFLWLLRYSNRTFGMEKSGKSSITPRTLELGTIRPCCQHHLCVLACHHMGVHFLPYRHSCDPIVYELELYFVGRMYDSWLRLVLHLAAQGLCRTETSGWHHEPALGNIAIIEAVAYCHDIETVLERTVSKYVDH